MYTHELGLTQKPLQQKTKQNPGTGEEGGGGGREQGWARRKASRAAAARRGPEPRPRDSEPDLIGVWRRELERGGHGAGGSGRPGAQVWPGRAPNSLGDLPTARQDFRPARAPAAPAPVRPAAHNDSRVASPSGALPPLPPAPTRPALTQGRRSGPGLRVTYVDVLRHRAGRGRTGSANPRNAWPHPCRPVGRGGRPRGGSVLPRARP